MHNQKMLHSLLSIQSAAKIMKSLTQSRVSEETTQVTPFAFPNISIPALDLPFSADVDTALRTLGLKEGAYLEARLKIQEWFHNLQHTHSLNFQRVCHNLASLPHFQSPSSLASAIEDVRVIFQNTYASHLPFITTHILSARSRQNPVCKNAKTPFNNVSASWKLFLQNFLDPQIDSRNIPHF
jgi:uncharacterized protein YceK